jgi:hypothetical protein
MKNLYGHQYYFIRGVVVTTIQMIGINVDGDLKFLYVCSYRTVYVYIVIFVFMS